MRFLELIEKDPERLTEMTHAEFATLGGLEGAEVIMWLVMRGALSPRVRKLNQSFYLPSITAIATAIYEDVEPAVAPADSEYLANMHRQLAGIEALKGTYPFTLDRSVKGYRLNKFLHALIDPAWRRRFRDDQEMLRGSGSDSGRTPSGAHARLAGHDSLRRQFLHAREARGRHWCLEPAYLRGDARRDTGRVPQDA
jgi:gallate dioxygenase